MNWLPSIIGIAIFIHLCFLFALWREDNSIMTAAWPVGLLVIEIISVINYTNDEPLNTGQIVLLLAVMFWSSRLFLHAIIRNVRRGYEDFRYRKVREDTDSGFVLRSYFQFFVVQGIFMLIVGIPLIVSNSDRYQPNNFLLIVGGLVFLAGWIIETIADYQLTQFKQTHGTDEVLRTGLWSISRHPNYLGEVLIWWGIGLISFNVSLWYVLISPIIVTLLLRYVSGVPMLEERYENNQAYENYKSEVPPLFPF